MPSAYHDGVLAVQRRAGVQDLAARNGRGITNWAPEVARDFLAGRPFIVVAHVDHEGAVWCSILTGEIGFVSTPDERTVAIGGARTAADAIANISVGRSVGLLALDPGSRRRMRANGTVVDVVDGELRIAVDEVFSNCPKYITPRSIEPVLQRQASFARTTVAAGISPSQQRTISQIDTIFVATTAPVDLGGGVDASHRGGDPGFLRVHDERHLSWRDLPGNAMFLTLGNLELDSRIGLLVVDWTSGATIQISGRAHTKWNQTLDREVHVEVHAVRETTFVP